MVVVVGAVGFLVLVIVLLLFHFGLDCGFGFALILSRVVWLVCDLVGFDCVGLLACSVTLVV